QLERDKERALQLSKAQQGVELALQEAQNHREQARHLTNNPASWQTTLKAALFAMERAEKLLGQEPALATGEVVQRLRQVKMELDADEHDRQLLEAFDRVREAEGRNDPGSPLVKQPETFPRLKKALAEYGLPVSSLPAEKAAALIQKRPQVIRE